MTEPHSRLREARKRAGFKSAREFAGKVGVQPGTYNHHETGARGFARNAPKYAAALGVSADWLLGGQEPDNGNHEEMAAALARQMTPEQRAAWFSVGAALAQSPPAQPGTKLKQS